MLTVQIQNAAIICCGSDEVLSSIIRPWCKRENAVGWSWFIYHDLLMLGWFHSTHPCEDYIRASSCISNEYIPSNSKRKKRERKKKKVVKMQTWTHKRQNPHQPLCGIQDSHPWQIYVQKCPQQSAVLSPFPGDHEGSPKGGLKWDRDM